MRFGCNIDLRVGGRKRSQPATCAAVGGMICISPKAGSDTVQRSGDELKLVWPQAGSDWQAMEDWAFTHLLIQPMDSAAADANRLEAMRFVEGHPRWRLSLQTHKMLGIP